MNSSSHRATIDTQNLINQIVKNPDVESIKALHLTPNDVEKTDPDGKSPFFWACKEGKLEIAEYLLELGSDINCKDANDNRPLHIACMSNHLPIVHLLLSHHCQVNCQNAQRLTPLHVAAQNGNVKIVEMLLDYHINSRFFKNVRIDNEIDLDV